MPFVEYLQRDGPRRYGRRNRDYPARATGFERLRRYVMRLTSVIPAWLVVPRLPFVSWSWSTRTPRCSLQHLDRDPGPIDVIDIVTEAEALRMATELDCLPDEGCVTPELAGRLSVERRDLVAWAGELGF